jgi:hypothetical protein
VNPRIVLPPGETLPPALSEHLPLAEVGGEAPLPDRRLAARHEAVRKGRSAERFEEINTFLDVTARTLPRAAVLCWLTLWRDSRNGVARTAITDIAARSGWDKRPLIRSVKTLTARGLVRIIRRGGLGAGPSAYKVTPVSP